MKKGRFKSLKKFSNILWFIGTILIILLVLVTIIIITNMNYKESLQEDTLANLARYNAVKYGYTGETSNKSVEVHADITEDILETLDTIEADSVTVDEYYNQVYVSVIEPVDFESTEEKLEEVADCWKITVTGVTTYGVPGYSVTEDEITLIENIADTVDDFLEDFESEMLTEHEQPIVLFYDLNYGGMFITQSLTSELQPTFMEQEYTDRIIIDLKLLTTAGFTSSAMTSLIDTYRRLY